MMQKLMEINDHLVRTLAECEQLRSDQKTLQEICSIRLQRITELQEEQSKLQGICADGGRRIVELQSERDTARRESIQWASDCIALQSELDTTKEHAGRLQAELDATRKQLRDVCSAQSVESAGQSDLVRDVSHYIEAAEVDTAADIPATEYTLPEGWQEVPSGEPLKGGDEYHAGLNGYIRPIEPQPVPEPECKPYTFTAYIVGDRIQPDALRIVWATEEWIEQSKFSIVHRISDLQFSGNDTFTPDQFSVNLKVQ